MEQYIGVKILNAKPMTRGDYNDLQKWTLPEDQDGADEGYLVEYQDGGKPNHPDFEGYISWSPKDVFEVAYTNMGEIDRELFMANVRNMLAVTSNA